MDIEDSDIAKDILKFMPKSIKKYKSIEFQKFYLVNRFTGFR